MVPHVTFDLCLGMLEAATVGPGRSFRQNTQEELRAKLDKRIGRRCVKGGVEDSIALYPCRSLRFF